MAGAFYGGDPGPVWPSEGSYSPWTVFPRSTSPHIEAMRFRLIALPQVTKRQESPAADVAVTAEQRHSRADEAVLSH